MLSMECTSYFTAGASPAKIVRFLLAQLHLSSLVGKRSPKALRASISKLPAGSNAYDHAYRNVMERIQGQVTDQEELAKQVLYWITCATRPLTIAELQHALGVEIGEQDIDCDNLPQIEDMVSACAGLVTVDEQSSIIRLVHYTAQEYFQRTQKQWFPHAEMDITACCVTYLSYSTFESGFCRTDDEYEERLRLYPLYGYAARNWGYHASKLRTLDAQVLSFLTSRPKVEASDQAMLAIKRWPNYSQEVTQQIEG